MRVSSEGSDQEEDAEEGGEGGAEEESSADSDEEWEEDGTWRANKRASNAEALKTKPNKRPFCISIIDSDKISFGDSDKTK
ncbi:hypothetical protein P3T76_013292 [Phytophthora citrophthora]|uniref:Uncharacterized protein n=1 Tax=Phytophthora citrophthora TaxID=4793 RepID=A0AAD9LC19_9STRA|nr:hypothetical protein P3T76_013292 [Phytophthora citrophthora]